MECSPTAPRIPTDPLSGRAPHAATPAQAAPPPVRFALSEVGRRGGVRILLVMLAGGALLAGFFGTRYLGQSGSRAPKATSMPARSDTPGAEMAAPRTADVAPQRVSQDPVVAELPPIPVTEPETTDAVIDEVTGVLDHLVRRFPGHPDAHEITARFYLWREDTAGAVKAWEKCLELDSSYAHAYDGLASVAAKRGNHQEAVRLYRKALSINSASTRTRIELAKALIAESETDEAVELLEEMVGAFPGATEAFYQLGVAYQQGDELTKAKQSYETTLALEPRYAAAQIGLARVCARLDLDDEAHQHQERYRQLRAAELEESRQDRLEFNDLQSTRERVAELYVDAGRIYLAQREPAPTEMVWTRAAEMDPRNANCRQALAWLYLQQGQPLKTIRRLHELADLAPENTEYPLEIARLYSDMNRIGDAEETLKEVCQKSPEDAAGYAALAKLYLQTDQKFPQALELAEKAVELSPHPDHYILLSGCHERNQNWTEAVDAMAKVVESEPENAGYRQMYELLKQQAESPQKG